MDWITVGRPGYLGGARDRMHKEWNVRYGAGGWRLVWEAEGKFLDFLGAAELYEESYYRFLKGQPEVLETLIREASEVYDDALSNIASGFDYTRQETGRTHVQDVAIRRCVRRLGRRFEGASPIQIRDRLGAHPLSLTLSPGQVPFHAPGIIRQPELTGWWLPGSVEAFYQSNRLLQRRLS